MGNRVLIAHGDPTYRQWLRLQLTDCGLRVVAEEVNGLSACAASLELRPDVVFLADDLPHLDGRLSARHIRTRLPDCHICLLTREGEAEALLGQHGTEFDGVLPVGGALASTLRAALRWLRVPPAWCATVPR